MIDLARLALKAILDPQISQSKHPDLLINRNSLDSQNPISRSRRHKPGCADNSRTL